MDTITTFTSDKQPLHEVLNLIEKGKTQLPEFQRGWIWDDDHIRSLLASVSLSYPIGAVMILETGNPDIRFKTRLIEGVNLTDPPNPEQYILDGQQRLTSLFQSLFMKKPAETQDSHKKKIKRWYYIGMNDALNSNGDREDAIISLPEDKKIRNFRNEITEDYSSPDAEYQNHLFPLNRVFKPFEWRREYNKYWEHDEEKIKLFDAFEEKVIQRFSQYMIPIIKLLKQTPKVVVCQVFEKVNTGGVSLTVFELLTATFAIDEFNLREDWEGKRSAKGKKIENGRSGRIREHPVLRSVAATDFLQAVTLLSTYDRRKDVPDAPVSCKRGDILKLNLRDYKKWAEPATKGFIKSSKFLFQQRIFSDRDLPYGTQVIPLASLFALLGDEADNDTVREKLIRWYWCGIFGELYGSAVETRFAKDIVEVINWIQGGEEPSSVTDFNFAPFRLYTLRTRRSAAYKGLYALLIRDGGLDFRTGEPIDVQMYFDVKIDIHHIFPRAFCEKNNIESNLYDSIINKTALSAKTNKIIGGRSPSEYLEILRKDWEISEERQDKILESHVIDIYAMKNNIFDRFFDTRKEALLKRIENATGKNIPRESKEDGVKALDDINEYAIEEED